MEELRVIKGRDEVIIIVALTQLIVLFSIVSEVLSNGTMSLILFGVRVIISSLLCLFFYRGYKWARVAMVSAYGGGLIYIIGSVVNTQEQLISGLIFGVVLFAIVYCFRLLTFSKNIKSYMIF